MRLTSCRLIAAALAAAAAVSAQNAPWWDQAWKKRVEVVVPANAPAHLRVPVPEGADPESIRVVESSTGKPLPHWAQWMEMSGAADVTANAGVHYGFPRMVRTAGGDILLFYRTGTTHAYDAAFIAMRRSSDEGASWSPERILHRDPDPAHGTHNPVALVAPGGRILLWVSSYGFRNTPYTHDKGYWSWSDDEGHTWAPFTVFDRDPSRSIYYFTTGIQTTSGLLISGDTFPPGGVGSAYSLLWHSLDGREWKPFADLTDRNLNIGDEVAFAETAPGELLAILRARRQVGRGYDPVTYRLWSRDGGKTWSQPENIHGMLRTTLQRPFLTRLDDRTLLLSGRDWERRLVVVFVSTDNGRTFGRKHVLDHFNGDGGYTTAVTAGKNRMLMTYYTDSHHAEWQPGIRQAYLSLRAAPQYVWVQLDPGAPRVNLHLYYGNPAAKAAEQRDRARIDGSVHVHTAETRAAEAVR